MTQAKETPDAKSSGSLLGPWADWRRKRFWLLCGFLTYSLAGLYLAPWLVTKTMIDRVAESGRSATIDHVAVNPFLFTLLIEGVSLKDRDGTEILSYEHYLIDWELSSIFKWAMTFKEIRLLGLSLFEERYSGLDTRWMRLIDDITLDTLVTDVPEEDSAPPRLIIHTLQLQAHEIALLDREVGDFEAAFGPIDVLVNDLRTLPDSKGAQAISIKTSNGGEIVWTGDLQLVPLNSQGHIKIKGRSLTDIFRYSDEFLPFRTIGEGVELSLNYDVRMEGDDIQLVVDQFEGHSRGNGIIPDGQDKAVFSLNRIDLTGGRLEWPAQTVSLDSLVLTNPQLDVALRPDGSINLLDLLPTDSATETPDASSADAAATPWAIDLRSFKIEQGQLNLEDQTREPAVAVSLTGADVSIGDISNSEGAEMPAEMSFDLSTGGRSNWNGTLIALPSPAMQGQLELDNINVLLAQPYLDDHLRVALQSGLLSMSAAVSHNTDQLLSAEGALQFRDLEMQDTLAGERLLGWAELDIERFEADLSKLTLSTSVLELDGLYGRLHIAEDLTTNVADLLVEAPALDTADSPGSETTGPELAVTLGGVELNNAALDFSDFSLPLPFEAAIRDMSGDISTLSTVSVEPARVNLEGQVNEFGLARINGQLSPNNVKDNTDITMVFRNLDMSRLSPYTVSFAGYEIEDGKLDLDLQYKLQKSQLQGANSVVMRDLTLGEKIDHPDAGSLPLGLAVALLKNSDGVIDIDVPVEGNVDDPEFRIGGVVLAAIGNLITKAVTAPFRLLGSLIGIDSEDFGTLRYLPGDAGISPPDREQLSQLLEAMQQRPELALEISGKYAPTLDRPALAAQAVDGRVDSMVDAAGDAEDVLSADAQRAALETLFAQRFPAIPLEEFEARFRSVDPDTEAPESEVFDETAYIAGLRQELIDAEEVPDADLLDLAGSRATAVLEVLTELSPVEPINAVIIEPSEAEMDDEDSEVLMELSVQANSGKS